jgi:hypothetical protein
MAIPALIKALSCFGLILALSRLRLHLSLSLMGGAVLGLWMGLPSGRIVAASPLLGSLVHVSLRRHSA